MRTAVVGLSWRPSFFQGPLVSRLSFAEPAGAASLHGCPLACLPLLLPSATERPGFLQRPFRLTPSHGRSDHRSMSAAAAADPRCFRGSPFLDSLAVRQSSPLLETPFSPGFSHNSAVLTSTAGSGPRPDRAGLRTRPGVVARLSSHLRSTRPVPIPAERGAAGGALLSERLPNTCRARHRFRPAGGSLPCKRGWAFVPPG